MDGSTAKRNQDIGLALIKAALSQSGHIPKTHFDNAENFKAYFSDKGPLLIDATEQRTQRPKAADYQQGMYSGKKSPYSQVINYWYPRSLHSLCEQSLAR